MLIVHRQFNEARSSGYLIPALKDCLIRNLIEKLPQGWGVGEDSRWQAIRGLSTWSTEVKIAGGLPELNDVLANISKDLLQHPPATGWAPEKDGTGPIDVTFGKHLKDLVSFGITK